MNLLTLTTAATTAKEAAEEALRLEFSTQNIGQSLMLMLLGMVGIFAVMLIIMAAVALLNKFAKDKK
jgi:hypothetical protein